MSTPEETPEIQFRSDVTVELVRGNAADADVVFAARVSTQGEQTLANVDADAAKSKGLINYLMRDRHGCYDAQTEVLTRAGWKRWPDVDGSEEFITRSPEGVIEYQRAERLIRKHVDGPMVRLSMAHVDLLVTPDHRMLAKRRRQEHNESWELVPASDFLEASHRIKLGGGVWPSDETYGSTPRAFMALIGFFIGEGYSDGSTPTFHIRKAREVEFLRAEAARAGYEITQSGDKYYLLADEDFRLFAKKCYDTDGAKVIPQALLHEPPELLAELMRGLMHSDGSVSDTGKRTYSTTSTVLAGQIQELALKLGQGAVIAAAPFDNDPAHFGTKPRYRVTIYRDRNLEPKIGWTTDARAEQVTVEDYSGEVFCVTVPNGVLYVRRNGIPAWCGNSPFEHNSLTFYIEAPILVFREFMRHRIASYNEESGRYRQLRPVFYVPGPQRLLVQQGKPGAYTFVDGTPEQHELTERLTKESCTKAYEAYLEMLDAGVAREVARGVLPVAIFSSMYVTMNARSLMNFLSLRTKHEDSHFPSFPQREIEMVAEKMEAEWVRLMPLTHEAFQANGRVAP